MILKKNNHNSIDHFFNIKAPFFMELRKKTILHRKVNYIGARVYGVMSAYYYIVNVINTKIFTKIASFQFFFFRWDSKCW